MRSTKFTLILTGFLIATFGTFLIASGVSESVTSVQQLNNKTKHVEFFQNQRGEKFEFHYVDQNELAKLNMSDHYDFVWGDQECIETTGNCGRIKSDTYVVVLPD